MPQKKLPLIFLSIVLFVILLEAIYAYLYTGTYVGSVMTSLLSFVFAVLLGWISNDAPPVGDGRTKLSSLRLCLLFFPVMAAVSDFLCHIFNYISTPLPLSPIIVLISGILVPICEEVFWRGSVMRSLAPYGTFAAAIISSLMFGLMHNGSAGLIYATFSGMLFSYLYFVSGSLIPCVALHMANNLCSLFAVEFEPIVLVVSLVCIIAYACTARYDTAKKRPHEYIPLSRELYTSPFLYVALAVIVICRTMG